MPFTIDDTYTAIEEEAERPLRAAVRTVLVATSRLSICEDADTSSRHAKGTGGADGPHRELVVTPGLNRRMYMRQMGLADELENPADSACEG